MNYWRAKSYVKISDQFLGLVQDYWNKLPEQSRDRYGRFRYEDNEESYAVRMKIAELLPQIEGAAASLGVSFEGQSLPPVAVGGYAVPVNIFRSAIEPQIGHEVLDRRLIVETVIRTKTVAQIVSRKQLIHMLLPWNWLIDLCALIIRFPFIILERAGLPSEIENSIVSQAIKIIGTIILVTFLVYKGVSLSGINIVELIKALTK